MLSWAIGFAFMILPSFSARILGIAPIPSYSHQIVYRPIWRELSLRGHQVTVLTTDPQNNSSLTNLTEIDLHFSYKKWQKLNVVNMTQTTMLSAIDNALRTACEIFDDQLQHPEVQKLLKNESEHFNLLIVECIYPIMVAFAERFNCPFIGIFSLDAAADNYEAIGNPTHPVLYPDYTLPYDGELTFQQRLVNVLLAAAGKYYFSGQFFDVQEPLIKKHFGEDYPPLSEIVRNVSMLFVNTDPIFHHVRPLLPSVVQIGGGTHLQPPKALPKDLQRQLDNASKGFIYFSLGSNIKSKEISAGVRNIILETFAELPYLVLWKFELEDLPGKPDNVIISKWFPQQDILRHPHIKLFITQGGLQSMEEAIYSHVPMVGMPFVGDQIINTQKIVAKGFGLGLDVNKLNKESFKSTILEIAQNPKYRSRVKELAELARDQPMTGLERAIWWTEYVLRHKGAQHFKSPAADLPWYQYFLVDVIGFCLLVVGIFMYLLVLIIRFILKIFGCFRSRSKVKVQ